MTDKIRINTDTELAQKVDEGVAISAQIKTLSSRLDGIKELFRTEGEKELLESDVDAKTVEFLGNKGAVKVTFTDSTLEVDQEKAEALPTIFGEVFNTIFETKIVIKDRKALNALLKKEGNGFKGAVERCMIRKTAKAKVSF